MNPQGLLAGSAVVNASMYFNGASQKVGVILQLLNFPDLRNNQHLVLQFLDSLRSAYRYAFSARKLALSILGTLEKNVGSMKPNNTCKMQGLQFCSYSFLC